MPDRRSLGQLTGLEVDPSRPAVVIEGLSERFRLYHERPTGLKERLYRLRRSSYTEFNALENLSLTVDHGEAVAIIGHNGSGKSTLLRLLARILPADEGTVVTNGRVASLLELGAGFHGDLTGRENIYLNGAILGLSRADIGERFDEIVDFAGIRPLLDTAVRTYSSGLYVRLGFAIAVTVDPDILLIDEVLAVGDAEFQARSLERMQRFHDEGKTILLVSHDLGAVRQMCDRTIVLANGRLVFDGPTEEGIEYYRRRVSRTSTLSIAGGSGGADAPVSIEEATLLTPQGTVAGEVAAAGPVTLRVRITAVKDVQACSVGIRVDDAGGEPLYRFLSAHQGVGIGPLQAGAAASVDVNFVAPRRAGDYPVSAVVAGADAGSPWAVEPTSAPLTVAASAQGGPGLDLAASATVIDGPAAVITDLSELELGSTDHVDGAGPR